MSSPTRTPRPTRDPSAAAGGSEPARLDPLADALELLHQLNGIRTADGTRLPSVVSVEGFEPWWFLQESLLWQLLVPYAENRAWGRELLAGRVAAYASAPPSARALLSALGLPAAMGGPPSRLRGGLRTLARWASRAGLTVVSLASAVLLRAAGRDCLVYILEQVTPGMRHDFRLDGIYGQLRERRYRFFECVHLRGGDTLYRDAWINLFRRRRPVVFLETMARLGRTRARGAAAPALELLPGSIDERDWPLLERVAQIAVRRARQAAAEIPALRRMLRWMGTRRVVALDDSRHVNGLLVAARLERVPTLGYMHGLFNEYHPGLICRGLGDARRHGFDLFGVWSPYFRRRLLAGELYGEERTFVCGPIRPPVGLDGEAAKPARRSAGQPARVLLVSEPRARQAEVARYVERLLEAGVFRVALKVRPGEAVPHFRPAEGADPPLRIIRSGSVYEALAECDVVVGTYSSVLYEGVLAGVPAVVLSTTFSYGHEIADDGLAALVRSPEQVVEIVGRAAELDVRELERRRAQMWGDAPLDGARELFDVAEMTLWKSLPGG